MCSSLSDLSRLYSSYGPHWRQISRLLHRYEKDCRDKWRLIGRSTHYGTWTEEENMLLTKWVMKQAAIEATRKGIEVHLDSSGLPRTREGELIMPPEKNILWTTIADQLKTRSHSQCRTHWYITLLPRLNLFKHKESSNPNVLASPPSSSKEVLDSVYGLTPVWTLEDDVKLIEGIYAQGVESYTEIDWSRLIVPNKFPTTHLVRSHFMKMLQRLANSKTKYQYLLNEDTSLDVICWKLKKNAWRRESSSSTSSNPNSLFFFSHIKQKKRKQPLVKTKEELQLQREKERKKREKELRDQGEERKSEEASSSSSPSSSSISSSSSSSSDTSDAESKEEESADALTLRFQREEEKKKKREELLQAKLQKAKEREEKRLRRAELNGGQKKRKKKRSNSASSSSSSSSSSDSDSSSSSSSSSSSAPSSRPPSPSSSPLDSYDSRHTLRLEREAEAEREAERARKEQEERDRREREEREKRKEKKRQDQERLTATAAHSS